jgi:hypothetical protein
MIPIARWYVKPHDFFKDLSLMDKAWTRPIAFLLGVFMSPKLVSAHLVLHAQ